MKFKGLWKAAGVCVLAIGMGMGATGDAEAQRKVRWKMHSAYASSLPIFGPGGVRVAELVTELSQGSFELKFFEPGALVPGIQYYDAVSQGSIDAAFAAAGFDVNKNTAYAIFSSMPFGPRAGEYLAWMRFGGGNELWNELLAKDNIKGYVCNVIPPEASGWFRNEIKSLDDLKGLKMRFYGLGARVFEKFGVSTQLLASGDIYPALELGTIDATEFSMPAIDEGLGFYQVTKHYYFPGWHQQATFIELLANKEKHDALSKTHQRLLETVCGYQTLYGFTEGEAKQFGAMKRMQEKGVIIHKWPEEAIEKFRAAWNEVIQEETANNPDLKKAWDSYSKFRADYKLWADYGYVD